MCGPEDFFFSHANEIAGFGALNLFFLVILSELAIQCVSNSYFADMILAHYLCTLFFSSSECFFLVV